MRQNLLALAACLLLLPHGPAWGQSSPDAALYNEFGLYQQKEYWEYRSEAAPARLLDPREFDLVAGFLGALPADAAKREEAIQALLLRLNASSKRAVPEAILAAAGPSSAPGNAQEAVVAKAAAVAPPALSAPVSFDGSGWVPLGMLPVDQAGTSGRGYQSWADESGVVAPGRNQVAVHAVSGNYLYGEERADFRIGQKYEAHTAAIEYRRGFSGRGPIQRFELGGQLQVHRRTDGFLNGFIGGFETLFARVTGHASAVNQLRADFSRTWPLIYHVEKDGSVLYENEGSKSGFGDVTLFAKTVLKEGTPSASAAKLAARVAVNISGSETFTSGNFATAGLSASKRVLGWLALHGDARANVALDGEGRAGLPLKRASFGLTGASEFKLSQKTGLTLQIDANTSSYEKTGTRAFDRPYGAIELGVSRLVGKRTLVQVYGRENMNFKPVVVQPNLDADFSVGMKVTIR